MDPGDAESLDEPAPDRSRRLERHLLRGDRGDERLEWIDLQRRPEAGQPGREPRENFISLRPAVEAVEIERQPEEVEHLRLDRLVVRGDVDAAGGSLDPHLPAGEETIDAAFTPAGCPVEAVHVEAGGREFEVVGLGQANEHVREGCQSRL